jgi:hypothetical protein
MKKLLVMLGLAVLVTGAEANIVSVNSDFAKKCKVKYKRNKARYKGRRCERIVPVPAPVPAPNQY